MATTFNVTVDDAGLTIVGTSGNDVFNSDPAAINTTLSGRDGSDLIKGATGSLLRGQGGDDFLEISGTGGGTMRGGTGDDTYNILLSNSGVTGLVIDELNDNGSGIDTVVSRINFSLNNPGASGVTILGNVENLTLSVLSPGTGATFGEGNALDNTIVGNGENNTLNGLAGNDRIFGSFGNDTIDGGSGDDFLEGNQDDDIINGGDGNDSIFGDKAGATYVGNDTLNGQAGNDSLTGGLGADIFGFGGTGLSTQQNVANSIGNDIVTDFNSAEGDQIQLSQVSFTAFAVTGSLTAADITFVTTNSGIGSKSTFLVYNTVSGELYYNANGSATGSGGGGFFATFTGAPALSGTDFVVV
ncbi:calcium-binding protein [Anabaena sp. PCC 7938]|uniref:Hemolysin-type calcium-binding region n=1 Tax=Anabaena cylindrica (strain ATCC 27899 / PCC 7122) TaxID=272123 RepID=K9ZKS9_ANACC|nr:MULTISPECIES: calcium-binding protein [Anabaena]AFZ59157.1 Hemolysin-type calcium-binding region [Anabaena cylindrica PCC 7122]MCM2407445.1 calcium-binding protein [Anabaena sp. CCAP 1446/1C]BAY03816.1 outer membrane secretion protein [Anabaena cylindrica PCC 7122]